MSHVSKASGTEATKTQNMSHVSKSSGTEATKTQVTRYIMFYLQQTHSSSPLSPTNTVPYLQQTPSSTSNIHHLLPPTHTLPYLQQTHDIKRDLP